MIDPLAAGLFALTSPSPGAVGTIFIAGTLTSVGPCIAPRYVAVAAIAGGYGRPIVPTLVFIGGLLCAFMALGFGAGLLGSVWSASPLLYALLAAGLISGGCITLARAVPRPAQLDDCTGCRESRSAAGRRSLGGVFMLGAASALVVSPCCTPVVAGIIAASAAIGKPVLGTIMLASFALGHALPLFFAASLTSLVDRTVRWRNAEQAPAVVGGVLMVALGAYYGVLA